MEQFQMMMMDNSSTLEVYKSEDKLSQLLHFKVLTVGITVRLCDLISEAVLYFCTDVAVQGFSYFLQTSTGMQ